MTDTPRSPAEEAKALLDEIERERQMNNGWLGGLLGQSETVLRALLAEREGASPQTEKADGLLGSTAGQSGDGSAPGAAWLPIETRGTVALKPCMHPVGEWACSLPAGHEGPHES